jgi:hypothetical protein
MLARAPRLRRRDCRRCAGRVPCPVMDVRRCRLFAALAVVPLLLLLAAPAGAAESRVLLALTAPRDPTAAGQAELLRALAARPDLSIGLLGATQSGYSPEQAVLDVSQGARTSSSTYRPRHVPPFGLHLAGGAGSIDGWDAIAKRGEGAPQTIRPGLLAASVPGGAGYVGVRGTAHLGAAIAADRDGAIASVSVGDAGSVVARARALLRERRLVVAELPEGEAEERALDALLASRAPGELLIVMERPPDARGHQLLPVAMTGAVPARGLTSPTTTLPGLSVAIDLAPTALRHLGVAVPNAMRGRPIERSGPRDAGALLAMKRRFGEVGPRRNPALQATLVAWLILLLACGAVRGWEGGRRPGLRIGALGFMWLPVAALAGALVQPPTAAGEIVLIAGGSLALGALTDRLLAWPRGPALPAFAGIALLALDAGLRTHLLVQSVLGPNPSYGSRFFGIGNELKSGLTCLLLIGLAAVVGGRPKSRRLAGFVISAGALLGVVIGSARLGAGVGGVILVAAGTATAALCVLPGRLSARRIAAAALSPVAALVALAAIDLATAGGQGHLSHNVIAVANLDTLHDIVVRRGSLALTALTRGGMPIMVLVCACAVWFALRNRWLYDPLPHPMWRAAFAGGLAAGIIGAVAEDSGPLLFVVSVYVLATATAYVQGRPSARPQRR